MQITISFDAYIPPDNAMFLKNDGPMANLVALTTTIQAHAKDSGFVGDDDDRRRLKIDELLHKLEKVASSHFQKMENDACKKRLKRVKGMVVSCLERGVHIESVKYALRTQSV